MYCLLYSLVHKGNNILRLLRLISALFSSTQKIIDSIMNHCKYIQYNHLFNNLPFINICFNFNFIFSINIATMNILELHL